MLQQLLEYLVTVDEGLQAGKTFKEFGAVHLGFITGQEILDQLLQYDDKSQKTLYRFVETNAVEAIGALLESMSSIGDDKFCMAGRFSTELMGN